MTKIFTVRLPFIYEGGCMAASADAVMDLVARGAFEIAMGALSDIAFSEDLTAKARRAKAKRIYLELLPDEDKPSVTKSLR